MTIWKYDLGVTGKNLRDAINTDEESIDACVSTLQNILNCINWIDKHCTVDIQDCFSILRSDVEDNLDYFSALNGFEYDIAEDITNGLLQTFYDQCDRCRIWIPF